MKQPRTRQATLYRLVAGVRGSQEDMFDAYDKYLCASKLDEMGADMRFIDVGGAPAIWIGIQDVNDTATWCADASVTTGLELAYTDCRSSGVLLLGVDGTAYAMSYGAGHLLIPDELKDLRFGLRFLIRRLDSDQVRDMVRRRPNARGRTDSTVVAAGAPAWMLGNAENVEIIRRIGGRAKDLKVTFSSRDDRPVNVEGSVGLKMRFGVKGEALVADIRECARVCREEEPDPALAFIEWIQPVADAVIVASLDAELEELLAGTPDEFAGRLVPVVPTQLLTQYSQQASSEYGAALQSFQKAAKLRPKDPQAQFNIAQAAQAVGQYQIEVAALKKYLVLYPSSPQKSQFKSLIKSLTPAAKPAGKKKK